VEEENARRLLSSREDATSTDTSRQPSVSQEEEEKPTDVSNGTTGPLLSARNTELNVLHGRDGERHTAQQENVSVQSSLQEDIANAQQPN